MTIPPTVADQRDPQTYLDLDDRWCAHNYHPLPVVIASADGAWVTDVTGKRYLDMLAGYSALNFGHQHPDLIAAAIAQMGKVTLTSRAFHHDQLGPFCAELAALTGTEMVLPMNSGAEAVESAIKVARKWSYRVKGVPENRAQIITAGGNFHGRTLTIVSFSDDSVAHDDYGPYTPGFVTVKYGDLQAMEAAITPDTAAILLEPIQGEAGVSRPAGRLPGRCSAAVRRAQRAVHRRRDPVRTRPDRAEPSRWTTRGFAPTSTRWARPWAAASCRCPRWSVGATSSVCCKPGQHGSTFGGNPLACAIGRAVIALLETGEMQARSTDLGAHLHARLGSLVGNGLAEVRGRGLWAGAELAPHMGLGRPISEELARRGILVKETHETTLRFAPPIVITRDEIDHAVDTLAAVLAER